MILSFFVEGVPRPQPRPRVFANGGVVSDSKIVRPWKHAVKTAFILARQTYLRAYADVGDVSGPIDVVSHFYFALPKSMRSGDLMLARPDGDNLTKAVWDALQTAGAFYDDSQIVRWEGTKTYICGAPDVPGATIVIRYHETLERIP